MTRIILYFMFIRTHYIYSLGSAPLCHCSIKIRGNYSTHTLLLLPLTDVNITTYQRPGTGPGRHMYSALRYTNTWSTNTNTACGLDGCKDMETWWTAAVHYICRSQLGLFLLPLVRKPRNSLAHFGPALQVNPFRPGVLKHFKLRNHFLIIFRPATCTH